MARFLARFSFSFLILAGWLAWEGYQITIGSAPPNRAGYAPLFFAGAAVCFALGVNGLRQRHRPGGVYGPPLGEREEAVPGREDKGKRR